jgi:hypothetical protein
VNNVGISEEHKSHIRKYPTEKMLLYGSEITRDMYKNNQCMYYLNAESAKYKFFITPWEVMDLSFESIMYSNDYRNNIIDEKGYLRLVNELRTLGDKENNFEGREQEHFLTTMLFGLAQEEFWMQEQGLEFHNFSRNYEILDIGLRKNPKLVKDALENEIGISFEQYNACLWVIVAAALIISDFSDIRAIYELFKYNSKITYEALNKFISYYTSSYREVRETKVNKNVFYLKPFIETSKRKRILSSIYYVKRLLSNGLYWVVRNYYMKQKSQEFVNAFGDWFELYLEQVLNTYLEHNQYERIQPHTTSKVADWVIRTEKFILILEQKSALAKLSIKQMYPDKNEVLKYLDRLSEGYIQLEESEKYYRQLYKNKHIVKVLVHYEELFVSEQIEDSMRKLIKDDMNQVMMAHISDVEGLIYLLNKDERKFNDLMDEKIKLEIDKSPEGRSFKQLLGRYEIEIDYTNNKLRHHDRFIAWIEENTR